MQIDRSALEKLLTLNDRQLMSIISRLAAQSGIDPSQFNIDLSSVSSIRSAIENASDEELLQIAEQYEANKQKQKKR